MTPREFWWLYPRQKKATGAQTPEWLATMTEKYQDKEGKRDGR